MIGNFAKTGEPLGMIGNFAVILEKNNTSARLSF